MLYNNFPTFSHPDFHRRRRNYTGSVPEDDIKSTIKYVNYYKHCSLKSLHRESRAFTAGLEFHQTPKVSKR